MTTPHYPAPLVEPDNDPREELRRKTVPEVVCSKGIDALASDVTYDPDENHRVLTVQVTLVPGAETEWGRLQFEVKAMLGWWVPDGWTVELRAAQRLMAPDTPRPVFRAGGSHRRPR